MKPTDRIPVIPLDIKNKSMNLAGEIMVDYTNADIYITSPYDKTKTKNVSQDIIDTFHRKPGDNLKVTINNSSVSLGTLLNTMKENSIQIKPRYGNKLTEYGRIVLAETDNTALTDNDDSVLVEK